MQQYRITKWHNRIKDKHLLKRLEGLPLKLVAEYLSEVTVEGAGRKFNALSMENDAKGYQISAHIDDCIGRKGLTTYPAKGDDLTAYVFPNKFDFLTWVSLKGHEPDKEYIIYHNIDMMNACSEYINQRPEISRVVHFKHIDNSGMLADAVLALELEAAPITYGTVEHLYEGHKDLSKAFSSNPQAIRAALKTDLAPKTFYEPHFRTGTQLKYKL